MGIKAKSRHFLLENSRRSSPIDNLGSQNDFITVLPIHGLRSPKLSSSHESSHNAHIQLEYTDKLSDSRPSRQRLFSRTQTAAQSLASSEFSFGNGLTECGVPQVNNNSAVKTFKGRAVFTNADA